MRELLSNKWFKFITVGGHICFGLFGWEIIGG